MSWSMSRQGTGPLAGPWVWAGRGMQGGPGGEQEPPLQGRPENPWSPGWGKKLDLRPDSGPTGFEATFCTRLATPCSLWPLRVAGWGPERVRRKGRPEEGSDGQYSTLSVVESAPNAGTLPRRPPCPQPPAPAPPVAADRVPGRTPNVRLQPRAPGASLFHKYRS